MLTWEAKAMVPCSLLLARITSGPSSAARKGSRELAPMKTWLLAMPKKKSRMPPPGSSAASSPSAFHRWPSSLSNTPLKAAISSRL